MIREETALKKLLKALCILGCAAICLSTNACQEKSTNARQSIIAYSITADPDSLDPQIADTLEAQLIVINLFEGLVRQDAGGHPVPGVAADWHISQDKTIYSFTLRPEACWSNGDPVTAEDFLFAWQRVLDPVTDSDEASAFYAIKNAEAIHQGTLPLSALGVYAEQQRLIVELAYPDPDFLITLTRAAAMPCQKAFFTSAGGQYGREADKLLCNGAFYLGKVGWVHNHILYLRQNPFYHGSAIPVPAGVNIAIKETPEDVCQAISEGTVDCYALPCHALEQAQKSHLSLTAVGETVWGITFNTQDVLLHSEAIRCALLSALERSFILQKVPDGCTAVSEIIPDTVTFNGNSYRSKAPSGAYPAYSPHAKEAIQKALSAFSVPHQLKLTILCADDADTQSIVNNMMQVWNDLTDTYVNKKAVPAENLSKELRSGNYQVMIAPLIAQNNSPEGILSLFTSDSPYSAAELSDPYYDDLLRSIQISAGPQALLSMIEAEQYISRKGIFYPLYAEKCCYACAPDVSGIIFHTYDRCIDFFFAAKT